MTPEEEREWRKQWKWSELEELAYGFVGMTRREFWSSTPFEFSVRLEAKMDALETERHFRAVEVCGITRGFAAVESAVRSKSGKRVNFGKIYKMVIGLPEKFKMDKTDEKLLAISRARVREQKKKEAVRAARVIDPERGEHGD